MTGLIALCLAYVYSQFTRTFLAVLTPVLAGDLAMTPSEFAYASGAWFIAFAVFQFPVGYLLDTIRPRKTAALVFTFFCGAGFFVFSIAASPWLIVIGMALMGMGCSTALMAPMYIFVREYEPKQFAMLVSIFIAIGSFGTIISSEPLAAAVETIGWQRSAFWLGIGVLVVGAAIFLFVKDPEETGASQEKGRLRDLFAIRELWLIFPVIFGGYIVVAGLRGSWIGPFHTDLYDYGTLEVGRVTFYMSVAIVLGTLVFAPLDRIFDSRKRVVMAGNLGVLALCIWMALGLPEDPFTGSIVFVLIALFGSSYTLQMAHGKSFVPAHLTGRGVTLLNFFAIGGAGLFQWLSGPAVDLLSDGSPQSDYRMLFAFYAAMTFLFIVPYAFARDAKPGHAV